ncbi:MAG: S8 family serine peptidase [Methylomicrobium sp.]|nr:S8 family serine peptidase [Methylomicrobium sp.]
MAYEYEFMDKKVHLDVDEDLVAIRFKEPALHSTRATASASAGLGAFQDRIEIPNEKFTIIPVAQTAEPRLHRHSSAMKALKSDKEVTRATPVFKVGEQSVVATDRVLVGFKEKSTKVEDILKSLNCEIVEKRDNEYLIRLPEDACPFETAKKLAAMKEVEYAEPDFVTIGKHIAQFASNHAPQTGPTVASDPLLAQQYASQITKAVDAWNIQIGDPSIKIAVLDEGVDTLHEDLGPAIVGAYDGIDNDTFQEPNPWDAHGTACSGLAAAIPNNNKGVRGIGGGCSLLAVRIARSESNGGNWVTSNSIIARSIDWAWQNNASILSNSWGGGSPSTAIVNAFERARKQGRGGKGCVIIIAAGNESGSVSFPGNLPNVLTVSASNERDQFKTKTSSDGENWWGSNFGPEVDIAAPGVHNITTDISGSNGYSQTDYISTFNGTSSATPIVAGAIGLVLSSNKNLTESEARAIITETADKVGSLPYIGGRNDQFGYGRLNVLKAVQKALNTNSQAPLQGTIKQFGTGASKGAAFFLQTASQESYLLRRYTGEEGTSSAILETQSLAYLAQFAGSKRTVTYARKQDTPSGTILWGVTIS